MAQTTTSAPSAVQSFFSLRRSFFSMTAWAAARMRPVER